MISPLVKSDPVIVGPKIYPGFITANSNFSEPVWFL